MLNWSFYLEEWEDQNKKRSMHDKVESTDTFNNHTIISITVWKAQVTSNTYFFLLLLLLLL